MIRRNSLQRILGRRSIVFFSILLFCVGISAQKIETVTFEELSVIEKTSEKLNFVFIHTSWCSYCALMEGTTFENPQVVDYLNTHYNVVFLDAETSNNIVYKNTVFSSIPSNNGTKTHALASLLNPSNTYPAVAIWNKEMEIIYEATGYINAKDLLKILKKIKQNDTIN